MNFIDFFPLPSYLRMPAAGFDISDQSLKYVELKRSKKGIRLLTFKKIGVPIGVIEAGQIKQPDELIKFLKNFRAKVKNNRLIASLPEEKAFIRTVQLPLMEEEEIRSALELQLEEHIPLNPKEVIFDYEVIESSEPKSHLDVSFAAAPLTLVQSYRDVIIGAGFIPVVFETEPHALARALIKPGDKNAKMIIDFGKTRTSFFIYSNQRIEMSSTIKAAGKDIDEAISRLFSLSPEQGKRLKIEKGLSRTKEDEKIFSGLLPIVSVIKDEAGRHLSYWKSRLDNHYNGKDKEEKEIEKIILCGGDSNLKGLTDYLTNELDVPAEPANPWINISSFEDYIPEIEFRESLMYTTAIGLALRGV